MKLQHDKENNMTTIEIDEEMYQRLLDEKQALQDKVDKYELMIYGIMKQVDKMIKDENIC